MVSLNGSGTAPTRSRCRTRSAQDDMKLEPERELIVRYVAPSEIGLIARTTYSGFAARIAGGADGCARGA